MDTNKSDGSVTQQGRLPNLTTKYNIMKNRKFWETNRHPITGFTINRNKEDAFLRDKESEVEELETVFELIEIAEWN